MVVQMKSLEWKQSDIYVINKEQYKKDIIENLVMYCMTYQNSDLIFYLKNIQEYSQNIIILINYG